MGFLTRLILLLSFVRIVSSNEMTNLIWILFLVGIVVIGAVFLYWAFYYLTFSAPAVADDGQEMGNILTRGAVFPAEERQPDANNDMGRAAWNPDAHDP